MAWQREKARLLSKRLSTESFRVVHEMKSYLRCFGTTVRAAIIMAIKNGLNGVSFIMTKVPH